MQEIGTPRFGRTTGDWDLIHGELLTFIDTQRDLPSIDRLEGFRLGGNGMYQRVMVLTTRRDRMLRMDLHQVCASERRPGHYQQSGLFWKSRLYSAQND